MVARTHEIWVVPRDDNDNEARAKRRQGESLRIDVDAGLMRLYGDYVINELGELDTDCSGRKTRRAWQQTVASVDAP